MNDMNQWERSFIAYGAPQEAESLLSSEARGTSGSPDLVNGWGLGGAGVTFSSGEIQKINSHSLLSALVRTVVTKSDHFWCPTPVLSRH